MVNVAKVQKSLHILGEMLEKRSDQSNKWKEAHASLKKKMSDDVVVDGSTLHFDLGWLHIIIDLEENWDITNLNKSKRSYLQNVQDEAEHFIFVLTKENTKRYIGVPNDLLTFVSEQLEKTGEVFLLNELQYNVTKHVLVDPHHVVHDEDEKKHILQKFNIQKFEHFPLILSTDPIVRFIGGKPGDLIRITRYLENAGDQTFYRFCVSAQFSK